MFVLLGCSKKFVPVTPGLDVFVQEYLHLIDGKRVGIITNHTALSANGKHIVDVLSDIPNVNISALFAPEHGIRGDRTGGDYIESYLDSTTGITVFSLYQKYRKPSPEMLDSVDVLLFDIMDIGARFYTYISTMGLAMEAAAENGIPFILLDRPNPITGEIVEGPVLQKEHKSFVGKYPIPIRHGLTVGELAQMINGEGWLENGIQVDLTVITCKNWQRMQWFDQTGLPWVKTSPNMPTLEAAILYPGMCLLEGVNVSEGRGTETPFSMIGAPWIDSDSVKKSFSAFQQFGILMEPKEFTPVAIEIAAPKPKFKDQLCNGFYLHVTNRNIFRPVSFGINLLTTLYELHGDEIEFKSWFDRLSGNTEIKEKILAGVPAKEIIDGWKKDLNQFRKDRKQYLLY